MMELRVKEKCPRCGQLSGVHIIYGRIDRLSEVFLNELTDGSIVLGGAGPKWDWEEELLDTKCQQCQHEWHRW